MSLEGYNIRKAAQIVAYFSLKEGGSINVLKLAKLLYLSERSFVQKYDMPMLFDNCVSMEHGPLLSQTKDYVDGYLENEGWDEFVSDRTRYEVGVSNDQISVDDLDELSKASLGVLASIWAKYGKFDRYKLRDITHELCGEWENPGSSMKLIPYERMLKFLGKSNAEDIAKEIESIRQIS